MDKPFITFKPFIISWKSGDTWQGKAIVIATTAIQAWEKFTKKWHEDFNAGIVDLDINEVDHFTVDLAADVFLA